MHVRVAMCIFVIIARMSPHAAAALRFLDKYARTAPWSQANQTLQVDARSLPRDEALSELVTTSSQRSSARSRGERHR